MLAIYSLLYTLAMLVASPFFLIRREKYASGLAQRLGKFPQLSGDQNYVIWVHCVSVGETNAARPLIAELKRQFPSCRLVISTVTRTGQELAQRLYTGDDCTVVYFPFDWKFSVRRALTRLNPSMVLLMETEIWPRFIVEAQQCGAIIVMVNGRLSETSVRRYSLARRFVTMVLSYFDLLLMQAERDANRIRSLGADSTRVVVTGNLKFDLEFTSSEQSFAEEIASRFGFGSGRPLIVAASTHEPEEKYLLEAFCDLLIDDSVDRPRLVIAPRHPDRFDSVENMIRDSGLIFVRRTSSPSSSDLEADVILLDSIGELRAIYELADIVFVGGSLIPHGGQSILEPAAAGCAIITGPFTHNFADAVRVFRSNNALIQLDRSEKDQIVDGLFAAFADLLRSVERRRTLGENAASVMVSNRGATKRTVELIRGFIAR